MRDQGFRCADHFLHPGHRDGPFLAGAEEPLENLLAVEALPAIVLLDDHVRNVVNAFVGGEAPPALEAVAPAPDRVALLAHPGVDNLVFEVQAERAEHGLGRTRSDSNPTSAKAILGAC